MDSDHSTGCQSHYIMPTIRLDDQKERLTILRLRQKLSNLNIDVIINENINDEHLGKRGHNEIKIRKASPQSLDL